MIFFYLLDIAILKQLVNRYFHHFNRDKVYNNCFEYRFVKLIIKYLLSYKDPFYLGVLPTMMQKECVGFKQCFFNVIFTEATKTYKAKLGLEGNGGSRSRNQFEEIF